MTSPTPRLDQVANGLVFDGGAGGGYFAQRIVALLVAATGVALLCVGLFRWE